MRAAEAAEIIDARDGPQKLKHPAIAKTASRELSRSDKFAGRQ
jgi:hypothetical protein